MIESIDICAHCIEWEGREFLYGRCGKHEARTSCSESCNEFKEKAEASQLSDTNP